MTIFQNITKAIVKTEDKKIFSGIPNVVLSFDRTYKFADIDVGHTYMTQEGFEKYMGDVESMLSDPSYQYSILEMIAGNSRGNWNSKKLGGTWLGAKEEAIKNIAICVDEAFENIIINVSVFYVIELSETETSKSNIFKIGTISGKQIKSCNSYSAIKDVMMEAMKREIEEYMKPLIEDEINRMENDIMMLKMLMRKYPNYKDLIDTVAHQ